MHTESSTATRKIAENLARKIIAQGPQKNGATVLALVGDLGAGKTTFVQGLARALGIKEKILSPTFLIFRKHKLVSRQSPFAAFYHVDLYRIKNIKELRVLGFKKIFTNPKNIVAIEWAEKARRRLPRTSQWIRLEHTADPKRRSISFD